MDTIEYLKIRAELKARVKEWADCAKGLRHEAQGHKKAGNGEAAMISNETRLSCRPDRRANHLAYCYWKNRTYEQCERKIEERPTWGRRTFLDLLAANITQVFGHKIDTPEYASLRELIGQWLQGRVITKRDQDEAKVAKQAELQACVAYHSNVAAAAEKQAQDAKAAVATLSRKLEAQ